MGLRSPSPASRRSSGFAVLAVALNGQLWASVVVYAACLATATIACLAALIQLISAAAPAELTLPLGLPWIGAHFRHRCALSAFFLVVINLGGAAASLFALGYGRHEHAPGRVLPFYPAFLAGMNLVVLADDAFIFLVAWEFMSLASWALVLAHHRDAENARGRLRLYGDGELRHAGAAAGLRPAGRHRRRLRLRRDARPRARPASRRRRSSSSRCIGAGSKAGLVPLHVWLPLAHPAAPSHVSALMSGVMTKVAVYGFIRIVFDLLGPPAWWWAHAGPGARRHHRRARRALRADAARPEARCWPTARSRISASSSSGSAWRWPSGPTACTRPRRWR